jgi:hypothetical protein
MFSITDSANAGEARQAAKTAVIAAVCFNILRRVILLDWFIFDSHVIVRLSDSFWSIIDSLQMGTIP